MSTNQKKGLIAFVTVGFLIAATTGISTLQTRTATAGDSPNASNTNTEGTSLSHARADHTHACTSASGTQVGCVNTTTQTFAGAKTFSAGTPTVTLGTASSATGGIKFQTSGSTGTTTINGGDPGAATNLTFVWPASYGSAGQPVWTLDGTGTLQIATLDRRGGGTGLTSYTKGDMLYYDSGLALSKLAIGATANGILMSQGAGLLPFWSSIGWPTAATNDAVPVGDGSNYVATVLSDSDTAGHALSYDVTTNAFSDSGPFSGTGSPTACTNQFVTGFTLNAEAVPTSTCTTDTLASAQHANQGTTTTVLHGNAAGNPSWAAVADGDLASNYSGIGACAADAGVTGVNDNAAPTCSANVAFDNESNTFTANQIVGTTAAGQTLTVNAASTGSIQNTLILTHTDTNSVGDITQGVQVQFNLEDSASNSQEAALLTTTFSNATNGSEEGVVTIKTTNAGTTGTGALQITAGGLTNPGSATTSCSGGANGRICLDESTDVDGALYVNTTGTFTGNIAANGTTATVASITTNGWFTVGTTLPTTETPGRLGLENLIQASAFINGAAGGCNTGSYGFNYSTCTRNGTGDYTVTWANAMASASYVAICQARSTSIARNCHETSASETSSATRFLRYENDGTASAEDGAIFVIIVGPAS